MVMFTVLLYMKIEITDYFSYHIFICDIYMYVCIRGLNIIITLLQSLNG